CSQTTVVTAPGSRRLRRPQPRDGRRRLRGLEDRGTVRVLQRREDLLAVHVDLAGSADPETDLVSPELEHRHDDVVADHDALVGPTGEYQHCSTSMSGSRSEP